ncbi:hypothetical protein EVAR_321_1 [Eumeta japonica]|uniref:Uncharacterized protein n=1 Tax=Eumeta variegata TaxID=151549 RepID=A0A4C1S9J3_EUMVA|nr:hypothetical protein EVAR_321_1 [Eumeta japonica]
MAATGPLQLRLFDFANVGRWRKNSEHSFFRSALSGFRFGYDTNTFVLAMSKLGQEAELKVETGIKIANEVTVKIECESKIRIKCLIGEVVTRSQSRARPESKVELESEFTDIQTVLGSKSGTVIRIERK